MKDEGGLAVSFDTLGKQGRSVRKISIKDHPPLGWGAELWKQVLVVGFLP